MKKSFEYDLTKYDPNAPTRTEQFLTADGVKTLTTDANDGAVLIQDSVDGDSLNPVTAAAVATAIEQGGGGGGVPDVADPLYVNPDDAVALRFGSGLFLEEGDQTEDDTLAVALSGTGGLYYDDMEENALAVQLDPAGGIENVIDDGVQVGLRVKVDGTTIQVNGDNELEAIGGGSSEQYKAGNGITIEDGDGTLVPAPYADYWPVTVLCNTGFVSVSGASCSLINFDAIVGSNSFRVFASYWDSLHPGQPLTTAYPYFLNVADSSKYVTSSSTTTVTKVGDYYCVDDLNVSNLVLDTSHAGEGFDLADLATSAWSLGFSPTSTYSALDAMVLSSNSSEWPTYSSTSVPKSISVTVPVPAFNTTTDVGKVLQVTANGLAWVTLS